VHRLDDAACLDEPAGAAAGGRGAHEPDCNGHLPDHGPAATGSDADAAGAAGWPARDWPAGAAVLGLAADVQLGSPVVQHVLRCGVRAVHPGAGVATRRGPDAGATVAAAVG